MKSIRSCLLITTLLFLKMGSGFADLPNAWHLPDNSIVSGNGGSTPGMRNPRVEFGNTGSVRFFSGLQKFNNPFGTADQNGGSLFYKSEDQAAWSSAGLSFHANTGNDQYWYADLDLAKITPNKVLQYYLFLSFNPGPADNAFIHGGGDQGGAQVTASNATAAANPFTVRNRPAWVFHSNNRVVNGDSVQFWSKVGYISELNDPSSRWADSGAVYYTTDGSTPGGSLGTGTGNTQVAPFTFSHPESNNQGDQSVAGAPMWWSATVPALLQDAPVGGTVKYKIGFWHSDNNEEKTADYQAGSPDQIFSFTNGTLGEPALTVNGVNGNYTSTHVFVDETAGDTRPLAITFAPGQPDLTEVQVFTNLNRRERARLDANNDGIEDGIKPPDGNAATVGDGNYFTAHTMNHAGGGNYTLTLDAQQTGAYRLTARWKVAGDPAWRWYTNAGRRDHAIVVSPVDSRNINLYEINTLTIESSDNTPGDAGDDFTNRSTFEDLHNAPNATHNSNNRWDLDYLQNLGCNWLWFQPIHPIGVEAQDYYPGSPYAVKNFFEINPLMSVGNTRASAMLSFQAFVSAADIKGVGVMLDAPFNHTAPDVELAAAGVPLFGGAATSEIRNVEARFFSRANNYGARAFDAGSIAVAPDRGDFGKWNDVRDVFFGNYSALVSLNPQDNANHNNEQDFFDFNGPNFDTVTQNVWRYFAEYTLFWLDKTGVPAGSDLATQTDHGVDGLRADFGQGLPPQLWEYIINKTRTRKWNFVFMSESLDGGAVTYRSNRHFDLLNENIVFPLASAGSPADYRAIFEARRNAYGQGLVLLNTTSHDEENYVDPFQALVRYSVVNTVDGAPLIFPGQELGISRTFGYQSYETNFGKQIAHFKKFNSMMPAWNDSNYGNDQLYPVYAGVGQARSFSPALRSSNRYYLDQSSGAGTHGKIFSVAKYEAKNAAPAFSDVVFAFANTDRDYSGFGNFDVNQDTDSNSVNDYGIKPGRSYNVKNIAAYTAIRSNRRDIWQWRVPPYDESAAPLPRLGSDILANGIYVAMNRVPTSDGGWSSSPYEAQYLKLDDVTPPPSPSPQASYYILGNQGTFTWNSNAGPDDNVVSYQVTVRNSSGEVVSGGTVTDGSDAYAFSGTQGSVYYATLTATSAAGIASTSPGSSDSGAPNPASATTPLMLLDPLADEDGDSQSNQEEALAGTSPLAAASVFKATATSISGGDVFVTVATVPGKTYQLETSTSLAPGSWSATGETVTASSSSTILTHPGGAGNPRRFYRAKVVP